MHFQFRKIAAAEGPVAIHKALDVTNVVRDRNDITHISPLTADLQLMFNSEGIVDVTGNLSVELDMTCSRCLKPLKKQIRTYFHESFKHLPKGEEVQDEENDIINVADDNVDLVPYVEQALLLNLPFAAVCKDDCKGLCSTCGADLNEQECGCDREVIDPRLAALKDFFKE
ncbi:uncharacterized protein J2Z69_002210 [Paenibacillus shirakamiensis]|uniref:DUF177 domain-containing protein n=1 Tax=Paenibacillus shirakamiensis TaxID=1265935 RepID=A0ABS4JHI1_9BACL|nr:DUF177 domain-containing protein [Paenibacillus shirakamiensis]MBP2001167.1 uncharacterized protein [Paenibacillus shirakamiensis]